MKETIRVYCETVGFGRVPFYKLVIVVQGGARSLRVTTGSGGRSMSWSCTSAWNTMQWLSIVGFRMSARVVVGTSGVGGFPLGL